MPRGLPVTRPDGPKNIGSAHEVAPPAEYDRRVPPRPMCSSCAVPPWAFAPFSAPSTGKSRCLRIRRGCHPTGYVAECRVSHPPDGSTPPRALPACFIRLTLMGFDPSEPSSSVAAVAPLGARCRPDVRRCPVDDPATRLFPIPRHGRGRASVVRLGPARDIGPTSRPCSTTESVAPWRAV